MSMDEITQKRQVLDALKRRRHGGYSGRRMRRARSMAFCDLNCDREYFWSLEAALVDHRR